MSQWQQDEDFGNGVRPRAALGLHRPDLEIGCTRFPARQYRKSDLGEKHRIGVCAEVLAKLSFMHRRENVSRSLLTEAKATRAHPPLGKALRFAKQPNKKTKETITRNLDNRWERFFKAWQGSGISSLQKKTGGLRPPARDDIPSPWLQLSLGGLLLSRARFRFTGPEKVKPTEN